MFWREGRRARTGNASPILHLFAIHLHRCTLKGQIYQIRAAAGRLALLAHSRSGSAEIGKGPQEKPAKGPQRVTRTVAMQQGRPKRATQPPRWRALEEEQHEAAAEKPAATRATGRRDFAGSKRQLQLRGPSAVENEGAVAAEAPRSAPSSPPAKGARLAHAQRAANDVPQRAPYAYPVDEHLAAPGAQPPGAAAAELPPAAGAAAAGRVRRAGASAAARKKRARRAQGDTLADGQPSGAGAAELAPAAGPAAGAAAGAGAADYEAGAESGDEEPAVAAKGEAWYRSPQGAALFADISVMAQRRKDIASIAARHGAIPEGIEPKFGCPHGGPRHSSGQRRTAVHLVQQPSSLAGRNGCQR